MWKNEGKRILMVDMRFGDEICKLLRFRSVPLRKEQQIHGPPFCIESEP